MGRSYAGVLGLLAFLVCITKGWAQNLDVQVILFQAWLGMLIFACVGYTVGWIAGWMVRQSVQHQVREELDAWEASRAQPKAEKS